MVVLKILGKIREKNYSSLVVVTREAFIQEFLSFLLSVCNFKPLNYCFKETIGINVKASFASRP